jgi:hypothetical protein
LGLGLAALQSNPTETLKAPPADCHSRGERPEIAVEADQDGVIHLTNRRDQRIGRIWRKLLSKQDHLMARVRQRATYGIRNAMVNKNLIFDHAPYAAETCFCS